MAVEHDDEELAMAADLPVSLGEQSKIIIIIIKQIIELKQNNSYYASPAIPINSNGRSPGLLRIAWVEMVQFRKVGEVDLGMFSNFKRHTARERDADGGGGGGDG